MTSFGRVEALASRRCYLEAAQWVDEHWHQYSEGLFRGFVAAE
jgi:hypothetical protein